MFERFFSKKPAPLTGAPAVRRQKTYSAGSGYVYQYFYEGQRPFRRGGDTGTEFVFDVSADRKTSWPVSVLVGDASVRHWQSEHGRELTCTERYAIAKMALFHAFDQRENPESMRGEVAVAAGHVAELLAALDID